MRTTLTLDDDIFQAARSLAAAQGKSLGQVVSELARKGLRPALRHGFPVFDVPADAPPMTPEMVRLAEDEDS